MSNTEYDAYGNAWPAPISAPVTITNTATSGITSGIIPQTTWYYPSGGVVPGNYLPYSWQPNPSPDNMTLTPETINTLITKMVTLVKPGERLVVCVDQDVTDSTIDEIAQSCEQGGLEGVIIRGARAGTGYPIKRLFNSDEERRVDILARIGEIWGQRPDLRLTDLLSWYRGEEMKDEDFAAAVEVHFGKVTDGILGRP